MLYTINHEKLIQELKLKTAFIYTKLPVSPHFVLIVIILLTIDVATAVEKSQFLVSEATIEMNIINNSHAELKYNLSDLISNIELKNNQAINSYQFEDQSNAIKHGFPKLPHFIKYVLIPPQTGVDLVVNSITRRIQSNIVVDMQFLDSDEADPQIQENNESRNVNMDKEWDAEYLQSSGFWPTEVVRIGTPAILRGNRILPVIISPLRWNRATGELEIVENIDFELDFTSNNNRINMVDGSGYPKPSVAAGAILKDLVINPPMQTMDVGLRNGSIVYVMGVGNNWNQALEILEPLIEWRRRMGWTVEVIRVQNNTSNAAIKNAIQDAYDDWEVPPEFVVICGDTDGPFPMAFWDMRAGANYPYESDHPYVMLDGDDLLADAAVGRLIFTSLGMLDNIVEKTVQYESDPFIGNGDDRGWQKRAGFIAGDNRSGTSSIDMCRWSKELMIRNGYDDDVAELYWTPQNPRPNGQAFTIDNIESGLSFFTYRGWTFMNGFRFEDVDQLRNGRMLPFVMLATCNTGDYGEHVSSTFYYTERFLYSGRGGAIGAVGAAGATHTAYNNLIATGTFRSFFAMKIPWQGWGLINGKTELYRNYAAYDDIQHPENRGLEAWECEVYIFNLMGDPAVDLYTDTPRGLEMARPRNIRTGDSRFEIAVTYSDNDQPANDVRVCLYKADEFQISTFTDDEGVVIFYLDPEWTAEGEIMLTVSGHNLMPELVEYEIRDVEVFLGASSFAVDDDQEGGSNGDDNGVANPTEIIELTVDVSSLGENSPEGEIEVQLVSAVAHLSVEDDLIVLDNAPDPGESVHLTFLVEISGGFPAELDALFNVIVTAGNDSWLSAISVPVEGPRIELTSIEWLNDPLEPGEDAHCYLWIRNVGDQRAGELSATLISLTSTISIPTSEGSFSSISPGVSRRSRRTFNLSANIFHIPGAMINLALILEAETGFVDTAFISLPVGQPDDGKPFGPDSYGYICIDDSDTDWYSYPEYDWIEISPHRRGPGQNTDLEDVEEEDDESLLMDLPFTFTYYGEDFDEVTICTNGWMAMGDCSELNTGRNRQIPSGMVAPGMICPFWEDLLTTENGGVYTYYDDENNLFIVEWYQMRKLGPGGNNEPLETFEIVLYDPEHYQTFTGDGDILFQYLDITDNRSCFQAWDTPFATVGMGSPDQTDGITYIYGGQLTDGAATLQDERAILFTTSVLTATGIINGSVTDAATGDAIAGAFLLSSLGSTAITDDDGTYEIEYSPANMLFTLTASFDGFNDSTLIDLEVAEDEEIEVNFGLLHPEIFVSENRIDGQMIVGEEHESSIQIENDGNGVLEWVADTRNAVDQNFDPWELREAYHVGEEFDDDRIFGVVFADDRFYLSGAGEDTPLVYVFSVEGELVDTYEQFGESRYGMSDLAYDGELIWGSEANIIYGFTPAGELIESFEGPYNPIKNLAWDPDRELLWVGHTTSNFLGIDREGNVVENLDRQGLRTYGLAYYPEDSDGYNLYIFENLIDRLMVIKKMNIETGDIEEVIDLGQDREGRALGIYITAEYDYYSWVMMLIANDARDDRLELWQLDNRSSWMSLDPDEGQIDPEADQEITLTFNSAGIPAGVVLEGELVIEHNAAGEVIVIPVSLELLGDGESEQAIAFVEGWNMISLNITPHREFYIDEDSPGPDIMLMTDQLRIDEENHHIIVMKDQFGDFYLPAFGFSNIEYWNLHQGYLIKIDEALETSWSGNRIRFDSDIPLIEGWNYVAYYPWYEINADAPDFRPISSILDNVTVAKDIWGDFMLPAFNFSNMAPWQESYGYFVKVDEEVTLNYPRREDGEIIGLQPDLRSPNLKLGRSDNNMSLLITEFTGSHVKTGDTVIAYDNNGLQVGSGTVNDQGEVGIAIWGKDDLADEEFGLSIGEKFSLRHKMMDTEVGVSLTPEVIYVGDELVYTDNDIIVLSVRQNIGGPTEFYLNGGFPNPFNSTIQISFGVSISNLIAMKIFDISGREIAILTEGKHKAGHYKTSWDANSISSGVYFVRLSSTEGVLTQKLILMR